MQLFKPIYLQPFQNMNYEDNIKWKCKPSTSCLFAPTKPNNALETNDTTILDLTGANMTFFLVIWCKHDVTGENVIFNYA